MSKKRISYREAKKKFDRIVKSSDNIVVTSHVSPDDDAISSALAVSEYLKKRLSKKSRVVITGDKKEDWDYFRNYDQVEYVNDLADELGGVDLLIMLDGSEYHRFTHKGLSSFTGKKVCIDHHTNKIDAFDLDVVNPDEIATSVIIYKMFFEQEDLDKKLCEILLLGLLGDSGNFSFLRGRKNADVFLIAERLVSTGDIQIQDFQSKYRKMSKDVFETIKEFMKNTRFIEIKGWPVLQYSFVSRGYSEARGLTDNQISAASHIYVDRYVRAIKGHDWGFVGYPKTGGWTSLSLRSLPGSVNVADLVNKLGIGGGHVRAAGARIDDVDVEKAIASFLKLVQKEKPALE